MSSKTKRLRKTNQSSLTQTPLLNTPEKSVSLSSTKDSDSDFFSVVDFESETVSSSSPLKVSKTSAKKVRRKKIRCTQDFNQLSSSLTEDSKSSTKIEIKRTKKAKLAKAIYLLPKIDNVVEDSIKNRLPNVALDTETPFRRKSRRKIFRKSNNEEKDDYSDDVNSKGEQLKKEKKTRCIKSKVNLTSHNTSLVDRNTFDSEIELCNVEIKNDNLDNKASDKNVCTNEYQSENSKISGDQKYSEVLSDGDAIRNKPKGLRKKNKGGITKSRDKCAKTNMNKCNLSNEEIDINNTSLNKSSIKLLGQTSPHKGQRGVNSKFSAKQININNTQQSKIVENSFTVLSSNDNNMKTNDNEQLILIGTKSDDSNLKSLSSMFNNTTDNQEDLMNNTKEKRNKTSIRHRNLTSDLNTSPVKSKRQKKRSIDTFDFMGNEHNAKSLSDLDNKIDSNVFDKTSIAEKRNKWSQEIYQLQKHPNSICDLNNSTKKDVRKSVRFLSPKEKRKIRRNTFDLEESTFDLTKLKSTEENFKLNDVSPKHRKNSSIYNKTSPSYRPSQNISTKSDGTFEVDKSHVLNQSKVQNDATFETPLKVNTTQTEVSDVTVPKKREILKSRSTMEVFLPTGGRSPTDMKIDIQNSTNVGLIDSENISQINSKHMTSSEDLNTRRIESFQMKKNGSLNYKKSVIDLITPEPSPVRKSIHKNSSVICLDESLNKKVEKAPSVMKLNRQSTFTKTAEIPENELKALTSSKLNSTATVIKDDIHNKSLLDQNYDSPLMFDISNVKNIDTSKVNKRKRWNKSRASVSFLDLTNIEDISAPWNEVLNATDSSKCVTEKDLSKNKVICQTPILDRTMSTQMSISRTFPSNTSTPYSGSKNVLLRQAIIRDKQNGLINKSKNLSGVVEKPVTKPKRKKMPNFALIHQRAYDKMENLKEMSERKAIRAKLLLSGYKPTDQNSMGSTSKSKKFLQFSPAKTKTAPLTASISDAENSNKSNILVTKIKNISPSTSNIKVVNKENKLIPLQKKKLITSSHIPRPKVQNNVIAEKKGFTRYGFKVESLSVKPATKEEQMKAVSSKTKIIKNTLEERRNVIKGVRSNRRFELLMRMRSNQ